MVTPRPASLVLGALAACAAASGCSAVLGGLDEGRPREAGADAGALLGGDAAAARCGWLDGFAYRAPFVVDNAGPALAAYQVKLAGWDAAALVAAGKLGADGADVRVTAADGTTVVPHWIANDVGESTTLWTRLDLSPGVTRFWIYYGAPGARDASSLEETFVGGVIDDPYFAGTDAWIALRSDAVAASTTDQWSATLANGTATLRLVRPGNPDGSNVGLCQTPLFPAGGSYRVVVDVDVTLADRGMATLWTDVVGGEDIWSSDRDALGPMPGVESKPLGPGARTICLGVATSGATVGQAAEAIFARPRVRRWVPADPVAAPAGAEQSGCP